ncbi:right-handed parallel beta-helix repeat-containing protein [Halosimplex marinum]|uniref:right-handed parallel beta-helix repeat-containing protein n=1 Tax=Halosimplex marinum TaxID=3396620 RepID=UPI003F56B92F
MAQGSQDGTDGDDTRTDRNRSLPDSSGGLGRRSFLTAAAGVAAAPLLARAGRAQESGDGNGTGSTRRRIEVASTGGGAVDYELTTTGQISRVKGATEGNDAVAENDDGTWTASGTVVGLGRDAYTFEGRITSFTPTQGPFVVRVDGIELDPTTLAKEGTVAKLPAAKDLLGGGEGYPRTVPKSAADVVVANVDELESALSSASSGDVVYVDGDATINVGQRELTVPSGVTLASNRGIDGAPGGEITVDEVYGEGPLIPQANVRVTGVRVTGPNPEYVEHDEPVHSGLAVKGPGCEIDNVEISGFTYCGVKLAEWAYVHHSHIHSNAMDGLGYGVCCNGTGGGTLVEYNRFNLNRHSVANRGEMGYEVRYNHFGDKAVAYQVGTHRPGGTTLKIHHNTFVATKHMNSGEDPESHVSIRGAPEDVADIHHNWFHNPTKPAPGRGTESVIQPHLDEFTNVELSDNHYGPDEPQSDDIGCPR